MMIGQPHLMQMKFGGRGRSENKAYGRGWKIVELAFNLWQVAVLVLCQLIVICG